LSKYCKFESAESVLNIQKLPLPVEELVGFGEMGGESALPFESVPELQCCVESSGRPVTGWTDTTLRTVQL
jgi:hypothetical protein